MGDKICLVFVFFWVVVIFFLLEKLYALQFDIHYLEEIIFFDFFLRVCSIMWGSACEMVILRKRETLRRAFPPSLCGVHGFGDGNGWSSDD